MSDDIKYLREKIDEIVVTLAKNTVILDEHVRRTNLLEAKVDTLEADLYTRTGMVKTVAAIGAAIGTVVGILAALKHLI